MTPPRSNVEIARWLSAYAGSLESQKANPYKVRAYRKAANTVAALRQSVDLLVRQEGDLTRFPNIGKGIAAALRELVLRGTLGQMELPLAGAPAPEEKPEPVAMLLDDADMLAEEVRRFLTDRCGALRVETAGEQRRRMEKITGLVFVVESADFDSTLAQFPRFRGGVEPISRTKDEVVFDLPASVTVALRPANPADWGRAWVVATGSAAHVKELKKAGALSKRAEDEEAVYAGAGLEWVPPELREGRGEIAQAARGELPRLIELADIRGDLHMHTIGSDGMDTIEAMAEAARARGYEYIGITDHSQSLKIARGVSIANLWKQVRRIDRLNGRLSGIRILKSAEVDILADGTLDYPDDLLAELDYTICSVHSRFRLDKEKQTERILRAMDHPAFTILGHATGRLILHRPGYEIDLPRLVAHAKARRRHFEINADPDRLDLSSDNVREVAEAGVKVAIGTDAHRAAGLQYMRCGIDVARRAGLEKEAVLNARGLASLLRVFSR